MGGGYNGKDPNHELNSENNFFRTKLITELGKF